MISEARYNDLTIFGLRSIFDYGFTSDPNKAIVKLVTQGVRPILAVAEEYRPVKKALIAYSGSMESAKAIRHFLHLKPWPDVSLHMVHFKEGNEREPFLLKDAAEFCQAHGFEVQTDLVDGQARTDLLPFAQDVDADVIVMGNSVQKTLVKHLLGDTVLETIKSADRPLISVPITWHQPMQTFTITTGGSSPIGMVSTLLPLSLFVALCSAWPQVVQGAVFISEWSWVPGLDITLRFRSTG